MNIHPLNPGRVPAGSTPGTSSGRAREASPDAPASAVPSAETPASVPVDQVQLSEASRALAPLAEARARGASMPPERLREVLDRIATGFYDRADVQRATVESLAHDLEA